MTEATRDQLITPPKAHTQSAAQATHALLIAVGLILVLAIGAYLRFVGLNWDENQHLHPDERFLTLVENAIIPVDTLGDYFDTRNSTLNPNNRGHGFFVYGDFPVILVRYVGEWQGMIDYHNVYLVGRALSAGFDLTTVLLIFLIGRRLYDHRTGLLASALYATTAFAIQQAHFFTVDSFTTTFVSAAFLFAARALDEHRWPDFILFGLSLGLAMASKVTVFPLAGILALALLLHVLPQLPLHRTMEEVWADQASRTKILRAVTGLGLAALLTVLAFRVAMPYAFLPPGLGATRPDSIASRALEPIGFGVNPLWLDQMREVRFQVSGQADIPPNHQWANRLPLIFPWWNMVRYGMGLPLGIAAWLGFAWAIWETVRRHRGWQRHLLVISWVGFFFTWQGTSWVKTMRYYLPLYPFLTLLAAWALVTLWDRVGALLRARGVSRWHWSALVSGGLLVGVTLAALAWGFAFSRIYTRPVTRVAASDWMYENIPSNVTFTLDTEDGPRRFQYGLQNAWIPPDQAFDEYTAPEARYTRVTPDLPLTASLRFPFSGTVTGLTFNHVADLETDADIETLRVTVSDGNDERLLDASLSDSFRPAASEPRGRAYRVEIEPFEVDSDKTYALTLQAGGGPLILAGGSLAIEGDWDDPLPLPGEYYQPWARQVHGYEMQMAWEDTPDKRQRWQYVLDRSDYLVLSSNRFYDSLSRIPSRWPMTMDYYEALFSGDLGFELVADFVSFPTLGPLSFPDLHAEEAFTVYDHPRVLIFHKTDAYSSENTAQILGQTDLEGITRLRADLTNEAPHKLEPPSLPRQRRLSQKPPRLFDRGSPLNTVQPLTAVVWWLLMVAVGWLAFPILFVAFPALPDRAYPLAKTFGLLFVAWFGWMSASVDWLPWARSTLLLGLLALAALSIVAAYRSRRALAAFLRDKRSHLFIIEGLTLALFVYFLLIRLGNPDLWHPAYGGEKPMDFAYFNAVLKSSAFPPYDPWFAGGTINYYYFGFVIVGAPVKLLGVMPSLAYNLILPTLYALTGMGAFTAAFSLVAPSDFRFGILDSNSRPYVAGMAALLMAVFLGNLDQIRTLLYALAEVSGFDPGYGYRLLPPLGAVIDGLALQLARGGPLPVGTGEWYWNATRLIPVPLNEAGITTEPGPITEFPYFTFLYADLHAHMIAMPLGLLALTWAIAQLRHAQQTPEPDHASRRLRTSDFGFWILNLVLGALVIGALRPTNTWDYPTYLLVGIAALAIASIIRRGRFDLLTLGDIVWRGAALFGLTLLFFLPYIQTYESGYTALDAWQGSHTPIWAYLDIHGLFLFILTTFLVWETHKWLCATSRDALARWRGWLRLLAVFVVAAISVTVYLVMQDYPTAALAVPLALWSLILFFRPHLRAEKRAVFALLALSLVLSLFVEVYVLRGDIGRMNTVFKFYLQVWLLLSVGAGAALAWLWPHLAGWRPRLRGAWQGALGILLFLAVLYPITATGAKVVDRWSPDAPNTLDGMAYMPYVTRNEVGESFSLEPDYEALRWLQDNVEGTPVILEANTVEYHWGNRVSIYTGLPAIVGWNWHQRQQRGQLAGEVVARVSDVATLYGTSDIPVTQDLLDTYDVEYIIVGDLERAYFEPSGLDKFRQMAEQGFLRVVFDRQGTVIYQVVS